VFDAADRSVRSWQNGAGSVREGAAGLLNTIDSYLSQPDTPPTQPEEAILRAAHAEYRSLLTDAKASLEALVTRAGLITGASDSPPRKTNQYEREGRPCSFRQKR
jgi:hypothetical protein